jgi:hypothetical protein
MRKTRPYDPNNNDEVTSIKRSYYTIPYYYRKDIDRLREIQTRYHLNIKP